MANINIPQPRQRQSAGSKGLAGIGQKAGMAIGGVIGSFGGPAGAVKGAMTGASLGGMIGGAINPGEAPTISQNSAPPPVRAPNYGGMEKRLADIEQSPVYHLSQAKASLPMLPDEIRQKYEPEIDRALSIALRNQQGVA